MGADRDAKLSSREVFCTAPGFCYASSRVKLLTEAFGFDVDSRIKVNTEIEFDVLPDQSVNVSVYPEDYTIQDVFAYPDNDTYFVVLADVYDYELSVAPAEENY